MQVHHLKTFITVADEGSFSKAAIKLFTSPSAIAQQTTTLEHALGFKLFNRSYQGVQLTREGEDFYPNAKQIYALTESAIARGRQISANRNTEMNLRIALMCNNGSSLIQEIIWRYKKSYPNAALSFTFQSIQYNFEELLNNRLDFFEVTYLSAAEQRGLGFLKLAEYPAYCIISENHPLASKKMLTINDLNGYHILVPNADMNPAYAHLRKALSKCINSCFSELVFDPTFTTGLYYGQDIPITYYPWAIKGCRYIQLDWDEMCPFGLTYHPKTSVAKEAFLNIAKELFWDSKTT